LVHCWGLVSQVVVVINFLLWLLDLCHFWVLLVESVLELLLVELRFIFRLLVVRLLLVVAGQLFVEGRLRLPQLLLVLLLALGLLQVRLLAVVLDVLDVVAAGNHVLTSNFEGELDPAQQLAHHEREVLHLLLVEFLDVGAQEANLLVVEEVALPTAQRLVAAHLLEELLVDQLLR